MKVNICVFSSVVVGCLFFSASAIAKDPCENLSGMRLEINGNGYEGTTNPYNGLSLQKGQDGSYVFHTSIKMQGEQSDEVEGKCKDRHIVFTRKRTGVFEQIYDGWIFEKGGNKMAGTLSDSGSTRWGWYGSILLLLPR